MVRIKSVNMHVTDLPRATRFWSAALGYEAHGETLAPAAGGDVEIVLDLDDRTHIDLSVADEAEQRAEVDRLVALGARRLPWDLPAEAGHVVLADPDGNLFCVVVDGA